MSTSNLLRYWQSAGPTQSLVRWSLAVGLTFACVASVFSWVAGSVTISSPIELHTGGPGSSAGSLSPTDSPPADFRLATLDGGLISPADYRGQVIAIEFWATWCGPCRLQAKFFEEVHSELGGPNGVQFLAIDVAEDVETVERFVANNPFPYPVLLDTDGGVGRRYDVVGLPTVMILDPAGRVSFLRTGVSDSATLRREIGKASTSTVAVATR